MKCTKILQMWWSFYILLSCSSPVLNPPVLILFLLDHSHHESQYQLKENSFCSSLTNSSKGKNSPYELLKATVDLLFPISTFFFLLSSWAVQRKRSISVDWLIWQVFQLWFLSWKTKYYPFLFAWQKTVCKDISVISRQMHDCSIRKVLWPLAQHTRWEEKGICT